MARVEIVGRVEYLALAGDRQVEMINSRVIGLRTVFPTFRMAEPTEPGNRITIHVDDGDIAGVDIQTDLGAWGNVSRYPHIQRSWSRLVNCATTKEKGRKTD